MTEAEFRALAAQGYNRIPLVLESFADLDTPLSLYLKLANEPLHVPARVGRRRRALRPLLVHRPAGEDPHPRARHARSRSRTTRRRRRAPRRRSARVRRASSCARFRAAPRPGLPRFCGGLAGYFGYDTVRHIEPKLAGTRRPPDAGLGDVPDILLLLTEELAVVDNLAGKIYLIVYADPARAGRVRDGARRGCSELRAQAARAGGDPVQTATAVDAGAQASSASEGYQGGGARAPRSTSPPATSCRWCCRSGCRMPFAASPLSLYRALRSLNPSPYMFYFDFGDFHVVGASPEILVRKEGDDGHAAADRRHAPARRDARGGRGARARSCSPIPKESAEHVMLVDLGRNDVGRVAADRHGARSPSRWSIERYSHVMHIVSNVEGDARSPGSTSIDVLRATFPGRHGERARRRCARWRSSTSSSRRGAASTPARSATSASTATWTLAIAIRTARA